MSARLPQLDNLVIAGEKQGSRLLANPDPTQEGVRPKTSANDKSADPVSDVEKPVDTFDLGRLLKQYGGVQTSVNHVLPLHSLSSEQAKGAATSGESKGPETTSFVNSVSFLPTVANVRRTAEPLRMQLSVASGAA